MGGAGREGRAGGWEDREEAGKMTERRTERRTGRRGVFRQVFGTAPPATDSSEAGLCGEEGFYRHFGTGTLN